MLERFRKTEPLDAALGLMMILTLALTLPALAMDDRVFQEANVWLKTVKFQIALAIYLFSLAYFARFVPPSFFQNRIYKIYAIIVCLCVVGEMVWIGGASANAVASHYNVSNLFMGAIYGLMGVFAVTLTSKSLVYGFQIWKNPNTGLDPALKNAIALGLMLTFVLTVIAAGVLSSQPGHHVGVPVSDATLPIFGWSMEVGDLRISHFIATHAMHALPLVGLGVLAVKSARLRQSVVVAASLAYSAIVLFTLFQALAGRPLISTTFLSIQAGVFQ